MNWWKDFGGASLQPTLAHVHAALLDALIPQRKAVRELRARWGKPGTGDHWYASGYFDLVRDADPARCVDDKTWRDLELHQTFAALDASVTPVGSQVLFRQMRTLADDASGLAKQYAVYARLQSDSAVREALQRTLLPLRDARHARIADFIFGALPSPLGHARLLIAWSVASLGVLVATVAAWPWLVWAWLAMMLVNVGVRVRVGISGRTLRDIQTLQACLLLAKVANDLAAMHARDAWLPQLMALREEGPRRAAVSRALGWLLVWSSWSKLFPISIVVGLLNIAFQVDLVLYVRAMRRFSVLRRKLAASFQLVGEVDAALATASWLEHCPRHCQPTLTEHAVLDIRDGRHPLLVDGVANSVRLDQRSVLVTGSNMAGKTTFVKMLGSNVVLGQTLGFCLAAEATIPRARVMASIQAAHSVASGKSHYFSEIETIRGFLDQQARGACTVLVIDELFSGTNTVERVAIARAVLEALGKHALVLATTHDVELQALLGDHYDLFHFQEDPDDGFFDYRLRHGPATERNAIRLLREVGFPEGIIASAMVYAGHELGRDQHEKGDIHA